MMESLMFSLNGTLPVFLVIALGYVLKQIGLLNNEFVAVSNKFNFNVILPLLLFKDMAESDLRTGFDGKLAGFCALSTTIAFFAIWLFARRFLKDKSMVGAFVQASYRCSVAVMGVALMVNLYGDAGPAPMMIVGSVPLFNIYAVLVLSVEGTRTDRSGPSIASTVKGIVTNPLLIGIALGSVVSLLGIQFPTILNKTIASVSSLATPQALICIGAGFEGRKALSKLGPTFAASLVKLVVLPAVFLPAAVALGFRDASLACLVILLGSATTPTSYVMAERMGNDGVLTSSVIVLTTLLSALTLTFWLFLLRSAGYLA
ncbi:AEC family transporter [Pseudoflavonifractor sp. MSJ-37]|uniref:AEC family transporter n=1 Tax=Pseudoflavonifractor sp. MSJ-37 TaxID=2841531 RepID=UPI0035304B21